MDNSSSIYKPINEGSVSLVIKTGGMEIKCNAYIISVTVFEEFNKIATAEILLNEGGMDNDSFEIGNSDTFLMGKEVEIACGYETGKTSVIFKGIVVKHSVKLNDSRSEILITAKHSAFRMTKLRKNMRFSDKKDSEVISDIIRKYNVDSDVEDTTVVHESLVQYNATDWDFVNMRAEANGKLLLTCPDGVVAKSPDVKAGAVIQIDNGFNLRDFEANLDGETAYPKYEANVWIEPDQTLNKLSVDSGKYDVPQGDEDSNKLAKKVSAPDFQVNMMSSQTNTDALSAYMDAVSLRNNLSRIIGKTTFSGYAPIHPGDIICFDRLGKKFNGNTIVTSVVHDIDSDWSTTIRFGMDDFGYAEKFDNIMERPASGLLPGVNGLQIAKVFQLAGDPLGEDRIQIQLVHGEETKLWARVAVLDAGKERGSFFMPEVDDEVIVGFVDDNPNNAVVLGMMHSSKLPVPTEITDDNNLKGFYSREKMKLEFDEEKKAVVIETPNGNQLSISEDEKAISLKDQNGNKIVLNADGIVVESTKALTLKAAEDINIEGNNVNVKANMAFKATGNTGAEVSTTATAVLKGSIVQIN